MKITVEDSAKKYLQKEGKNEVTVSIKGCN